MSFETLIDTTLRDPLATASNERVVGYVGAYVPVELIRAAQAQPVRLQGRSGLSTTNVATTNADRFVEASFSASSRRITEQWLAGELDALQAVIFSRSDDSVQRLYYYICELQRTGQCAGPTPLLFDIAGIQRASSVAYTVESTQRLAASLGSVPEQLPRAIAQTQRRFHLLTRLAEQRAMGNILGTLAHRVLRAAESRWTTEFDDAFERWLDSSRSTTSHRRLLLVGSEPTDQQLHEAAEAAGANFITEINEAVHVGHVEHAHEDPLLAIATRCHRRMHDAQAVLRSADLLTTRARTLQADGAVLWLAASDTGLAWEAPRIEHALRSAGCAVLKLVLQEAASDATTLERVAHFSRTLEVQ
jgi:hypothetical protein